MAKGTTTTNNPAGAGVEQLPGQFSDAPDQRIKPSIIVRYAGIGERCLAGSRQRKHEKLSGRGLYNSAAIERLKSEMASVFAVVIDVGNSHGIWGK